ncbi:F0F1 ATP synthase subunit gamma [soil metagenome]
MPSTRDIRRRIKSVKNTSQITKAMQLVAASKMKKAQDQAVSGRDYADLLNRVLISVSKRIEDLSHPLMEERKEGKELIILVSTDKGLCGALNTNLLRKTFNETAPDAEFITVGRKGVQRVRRMDRHLVADFHVGDPASSTETRQVAKFATDKFLEDGYSVVRVAFTNFINTLSQEPYLETLLPISPVHIGKKREFESLADSKGARDEGAASEAENIRYLFEPTPEAILDATLPQYISFMLYQMIMEARASEHSARMVAMQNATENAKALIKDLTLEYNKLRQAAITNELLEITTAMKALE